MAKLIRKPLTVKEMQDIKVRLQTSTQAETAQAFNRNATVIRRIKGRIENGTFEKALEKARRREGSSKDGKLRKKILSLHGMKMTIPNIADELRVTKYFVLKQLRTAGVEPGQGRPIIDHDIRQQVHALRSQNVSFKEIAEKLGIERTKAYYHASKPLNGAQPPNGAAKTFHAVKSNNLEVHTNGHRNGEVNKHVLVGVAYAETERFIGLLSERLGVAITILRPRLSELLGHPPIR